MLSALLFLPAALATAGFDPSSPAEVFTDETLYTQDGALQLWGSIERHEDPDRSLFAEEHFNTGIAWTDSSYSPWIATMFGEATPPSWSFLLHVAPGLWAAHGTPILFVPGAGDNGSRGFITMATRFDIRQRPVFVMTFAHPHGDVFMQAEAIADAIARVREITGAAQVDLVSHSKGGIASAVYLSNVSGASWPNDAYARVGTHYRGDVRKAVFIATPLGGIDTTYRWPSSSFASLDADAAISPSAWTAYYPYTTASWVGVTDLTDQDLLPDGEDYFPGQRQLYARQDDYPLPGSLPWLGAYALQTDWYTTYEGGLGYYTSSEGIDAAVEAGGDLIAHLHTQGADPSIRLYLLAGENPVMPSATRDYLATAYGEAFADMLGSSLDTWAGFVSDLVGDGLMAVGLTESEVQGLSSGALVLGEVSGPSDGLVFVSSALDAGALDNRGADVVETYTANLSHLDLLYASPITGELLIEAAAANPDEDGWMEGVGERYIEADTLGWVERVLADEDTGGDTGGDSGEDSGGDTGVTDDSGADDSGANGTEDSGAGDSANSDTLGEEAEDDTKERFCAVAGGGAGLLPLLGGVAASVLLARRRRG